MELEKERRIPSFSNEDALGLGLCAAEWVREADKHPRLMAQALEAGLHCWVEKPAAMTSGELFALQEKAGDRVVMVGYKKAFMPAVRSIGSFLCAMKMVWGPIFYILRMA